MHSSAEYHKADCLFSCPEQGCVKMFTTFDNLQQHVDAERHVFMEEQDQHMTSLRRNGPVFCPVLACKSKVQFHLLTKFVIVPLRLEKPSK